MSEPHIADGEAQFIAYNISPDFCKVGKKVVPFDIVRILEPQKCDYAVSVFARDEPVLMVDSIVAGVEGDKGKGVGSKVSQGKGHVEIIEGSATVMIESRCAARHDDLCLMNVRVEGAPQTPEKPETPKTQTPGSAAAGSTGTQSASPPATANDLKIPKTPDAAPKSINLTKMNGTFDELWGKSLPSGRSQEQGGTIVADANGDLSIVNTGGGRSGSFPANLNVGEGKTVIGVFHTHPYDASEGGHTGVSLSRGDAGYMIDRGHSVIIAQSGDQQFAYLRTETTPPRVSFDTLNRAQNQRITELVGQGKSFPDASRIAAGETATSFGLAYYEGKGGVLQRVKP